MLLRKQFLNHTEWLDVGIFHTVGEVVEYIGHNDSWTINPIGASLHGGVYYIATPKALYRLYMEEQSQP